MSDLVAFVRARLNDQEKWSQMVIADTLSDLGGVGRHFLHEVEAMRAIVDSFASRDGWDLPEGVHDGRDPGERMRDEAVRDELEDVVMTLASIWRGHPDYDPAWDA